MSAPLWLNTRNESSLLIIYFFHSTKAYFRWSFHTVFLFSHIFLSFFLRTSLCSPHKLVFMSLVEIFPISKTVLAHSLFFLFSGLHPSFCLPLVTFSSCETSIPILTEKFRFIKRHMYYFLSVQWEIKFAHRFKVMSLEKFSNQWKLKHLFFSQNPDNVELFGFFHLIWIFWICFYKITNFNIIFCWENSFQICNEIKFNFRIW